MIGTLYRYPHPCDPTKFLYCGQGPKRDAKHRSGKTPFGRRFKKMFPDVELPQPIREQVEVADQLELNELETIWMFRFHTWRGYPDGMNITLPGSIDYKVAGKLRIAIHGNPHTPEGSSKGGRTQGPISGRKAVESGQLMNISTPENRAKGGRTNAESGHMSKIGKLYGAIQGRKAVESGQLASVAHLGNFAQPLEAKRLGGKISSCLQWNIRRSKPCTCGKHKEVAA